MKLFKTNTIQSQKKKDLKRSNIIEIIAAMLIIVFVNIIGHYLFGRLDLTAEHRYTLSKATKEMIKNVDEPLLFRVYLEGDFPGDFKRLQNETKEMLNQFRAYNKNIDYEFVNPNSFEDKEEQQQFYQKLAAKGIQPTQIQVNTPDGVTQQIIIPAADVIYKGRETSVQLLQSQKYVAEDENLNNSVQNLEYTFANAIRNLSRLEKPSIGFLLGHGELERGSVFDIQMSLLETYREDNVVLDNHINALTGRTRTSKDSTMHFGNKFDVLVIAKPIREFSDMDLYLIDQYVMYGGSILWLIDPLDADLDSLAEHPQSIATRLPLGLDEMLFTYGVRINPDLVMDIRCRPIPMAVGNVGDKRQISFRPWFYFPELVPTSQHPIVRNLDLIKTDFVSSIDLIENDIKKTILLSTSEFCRVKNAPAIIDLQEGQMEPDKRLFNRSNLPVAVLLEGQFKSMWRNRLAPSFTEIPEMGYKELSEPTKMIVISDGDMIKNRFNYEDMTNYPLGYDYYTQTMYANKEFILNAINYLAGDEQLLETRMRDITLRKLNVMKVKERRTSYQILNVVIPVILVIVAGVVIVMLRKRRFQK